jgi:hypothetical protein
MSEQDRNYTYFEVTAITMEIISIEIRQPQTQQTGSQ